MTSERDSLPAFLSVATRLEEERARARTIVERQLGCAIAVYMEKPVPDEWRTLGMAMELVEMAPKVLERDPQTAKQLPQYAIVILSGLSSRSYPATLILGTFGAAWKEVANAHRYRSEYAAAHRALDAADRYVADVLTLAHDRAILQLARALVFCDQGAFDSADSVVAKAAQTFEEHADWQRTAQCVVLQGMSEHRRGRFGEACLLYEKAIDLLHENGDLASLASAYNNLGLARAELHDLVAAVTALHQALAIFSDLGMTGEVVRGRGVLGKVLLAQGRYGQARDLLREVRGAFQRLGLPEEAGIIGLMLFEALVALREPERARALVEDVISEFREAGLGARAEQALSYLREMAISDAARGAARHVREYLSRLRRNPRESFVPLPGDRTSE